MCADLAAAEKAEAAQKGWIHGDADKLAPEVQQAIKGVSLAGGRPLLMDVLGSAFKHVAETENLSHEELNEHIRSVHDYLHFLQKEERIFLRSLESFLNTRRILLRQRLQK